MRYDDGTIRFTVPGVALPAGSKRAFANKKTGRVAVVDANPSSAGWKTEVARAARLEMEENGPPELYHGPLWVTFSFYFTRPKGHYGKHGVLPSAPDYPAVRPDALKLARGVEDALTGIVWRDDSQIVAEIIHKMYGDWARVEILVGPATVLRPRAL